MRHYGREPVKVSYHPVKFDGQDRVISKDQVIKGPSDFIGGSPSWQVLILSRLLAIGNVVVDI